MGRGESRTANVRDQTAHSEDPNVRLRHAAATGPFSGGASGSNYSVTLPHNRLTMGSLGADSDESCAATRSASFFHHRFSLGRREGNADSSLLTTLI